MGLAAVTRKLLNRGRKLEGRRKRRLFGGSHSPRHEVLESRDLLAANPIITEIHPAGSGNSTYAADWFELTNIGSSPLDITGWRMDDNSNAFANSVALNGITSVAPGESVIFLETSNLAGASSAFLTAWFGATPPAGLQIGSYNGSGVGLSTGGDGVNLFDAGMNHITGVNFGSASSAATFDNTAGLATVTAMSVAGVNSAFLSANGSETGSPGKTVSNIDLSTYVRVGRYDLPEPTRTTPPANSLLAQEVSAVTYNWDTDTLFVVGDGGTSIVQVTKTGQLIDSMTLSPGGSPQGTEFYDPEGLTYVGNGQFVMTEERDRLANLFTYVAGSTLTRGDVQTVALGTNVGNIGIEGISYDPLTGGYIAVKETSPMGIFQTGIDFDAGTATNGSATTVNSIDLFNPALTNMLDFADVFALSNLPSLTGQADYSRLLVLSQESGKIVNIDRSGNIYSSLTIVSDPGNPLDVASQQHEGLTMDRNGFLYIVSENGGGDFDHPQLWVYAPSTVPNQAPTGVVLDNVLSEIAENTNTASPTKVADIVVADDGLGNNNLYLTGTNAAQFEILGTALYLKAGVTLDFETQNSYSVIVNVDDPALGGNPDASTPYTLTVTDVEPETGPAATLIISEVAPWSSGNSPVGADWFEVTNIGSAAVNITGWKVDDGSNSFAAAALLNGITSIAPGESVIFIETADLPGSTTVFLSTWFGANVPAGLQIGSYSGSGLGLSTGGDGVSLFNAGGTLQASVSFGAAANGPYATFDNAAGLNNATISQLSKAGTYGAFVATEDVNEIGSPGTVGRLFISEVAPWSSGNSPVGEDWFELTNGTAHTIDLTGWKMDDSSGSPVAAVPLTGITSIAPGESVIFIETGNLSELSSQFLSNWFGTTPPAGLQIGAYTGSGVGLSTGGDAIHLYNASNVLQASLTFGNSPSGPFPTFENPSGLNNVTVSQLSTAGMNGAFQAVSNSSEVGSPGTIGRLFISEVAPWSSGDSPIGSDWFEVTNSTAYAIDLTGWKMDDSSASLAAAVSLSGITSIAPGESVIFIETSNLSETAATFLSTWFGGNPPAGLQIGSYSGSGVGLSTGGDAVNLFDSQGVIQASVSFGASPGGPVFGTFDNAIGLNGTLISRLSVLGSNGAFTAKNDANEVGSPGTVSNLAPSATADAVETAEDSPVVFNVLTNDADPNGDSLSVLNFGAVAHGTLVAGGGGSFTYTPAANFNGSDSFTYTLTDGHGGTATATVSITVTAVNDQPTADPKQVSTSSSTPVVINLSGSDVETPSGSLTFSITQQPQHGWLSIDGSQVTYHPELGFQGTDSFRYVVTDTGEGDSLPLESAEAEVSIDVTGASQPVVFVGEDPLHPGKSALFVIGTSEDDKIQIKEKKPGRYVVDIKADGVRYNETFNGSFSRIVVYGLDGDDHVQAASNVETWIYGGNGDDHLQGGPSTNLLMGEAGDDHLQAGGDRDILIGGLGSDLLQGGFGQDILIGGTTDWDLNEEALGEIMAVWNSSDNYYARVLRLYDNSFAYRLNASTVHDDDASDTLIGGLGLDLFFAELGGNRNQRDKVPGLNLLSVIIDI